MKYHTFILLPLLFSICLCEVDENKKNKLLLDFMNYYNLQPNVIHEGIDESLLDIREIDPTTYHVDVSFTVDDGIGTRKNNCSATIKEVDGGGISIVNHDIQCTDVPRVEIEDESTSKTDAVTVASEVKADNVVQVQQLSVPGPETLENSAESSEVRVDRTPIKLENEVQADTAVTSGEQFIAIPRNQSSAPCIGCSSHVNPEAKGVRDLVNLGLRHLDIHEPTVNHRLISIIDVERQVQVVNGVRYILTLSINFTNCTESVTELCDLNKICKITILVKPWQTLPSGGKYRAILANNCTEEWLFGDNGEVLPESTDVGNTTVDNDDIRPVIQKDLQSQSTLTEDRMKALEDQIIPSDHVHFSEVNLENSSPNNVDTSKDHIVKDTSTQRYSDNSLQLTESEKHETSNLSQDKKNAVDKMLDFFNFSEFTPKVQIESKEVVSRVKRSQNSHADDFYSSLVPGGILEGDPNDEKFLQLANESLQKYVSDSGNEQSLKVDHIDNVSTQVVAGIITRITFVASATNNTGINIMSCFSEIFEQPWINTKDIKVSCKNDISRVKRQVMTGGEMVQDPNKPEYLQLAKESLSKYLIDSGNQQPYRVIKVDHVTTQVVAGSITRINFVATRIDDTSSNSLNCFSKIWEQSWLNKKEINVSCDIGNNRVRRQIPGGETVQNPEDNQYFQLAEESLNKYVRDSGNLQALKVVRVDQVTTQVVSGLSTKINFVASSTDNTNSNSYNCVSKIWEQSWLNKKEIDVTCNVGKDRVRRQIPGGETVQNPEDKQYFQLAEESLNKYVRDSGNLQPLKVVRVDQVTTQVVSGSLTKINFVASSTDNTNSNSYNCVSKIWEQSWLNKKEIDVTCNVVTHKVRRQLIGGETLQNPNNLIYLELAQESLQKYLSDHGIWQPHIVVRVDRVTTQVVAGSLTRINFVATPTDYTNSYTLNCFSKIWEQSWLNKKEINVSCDIGNNRVRRQIPGGETVQNPEDHQYFQLAEESLKKYVIDNGNLQPLKVVRVDQVTTQVVSGLSTKINFVASSTDNTNSNSYNCVSKIWEQSWLNKKEIDVSCDVGNNRVRRQIPGGETVQNPEDKQYFQLAEESLNKYVRDSGNLQPLKVVRVDQVTTQVVSGISTKINFVASSTDNTNSNSYNCVSKIWEQSWLNKKEIDVSCDVGNNRVRRQIPGGETVQNPEDKQYFQLAEESLKKYVRDSGNLQPLKVVRVDQVTTKVVSGSLTTINFVASSTDKTNSNSYNCVSKIWEQSWLNKKEIDVTCDVGNNRVRRQIPGGETVQNPEDKQYFQLAEESLNKYVRDSGNLQPLKVVRVDQVTTQVVSGSLTKINFVASSTDNTNSNSYNCVSKIWEQSWLNKKEIDVTCNVGKDRVRRQIPGGETVQNPEDKQYFQLAEESLNKYVRESGNLQPLKVVRVDQVTTKVVSGSLTTINFVASSTDKTNSNSYNCVSKIWEQSWLNKKEIDVTCNAGNNRVRRQIPGGETVQNPEDKQYFQLAEESLNKYVRDSGNLQALKVVRVDQVTTQVVSGISTKINFVASSTDNTNSNSYNCVSKIWEQSWLNKKEIDVTCNVVTHKVRRQLIGGETLQNPNNLIYLELAQESLQKYLSDHGIWQPHIVVRVDRVTTQVVAGSLTRINFVATPTDYTNSYTLNCFSKIWEQSWLNKKEINVSCDIGNNRVRRQIPGGETVQNPEDKQYFQLAEESLNKYVRDSGNLQPLKVVRVDQVATQVVSGLLTKINFVASSTDKTNSNSYNCVSKIWEQSWLNKKEIDVSCDVGNNRVRRQIPGGETVQNPEDKQYFQLAEESLNKYVRDSGNLQPLKVVRVDQVTTQVVSGISTKINFVASSTDNTNSNSYNCVSKIWEQSWLNKKEIDVTCNVVTHKVRRQLIGGETLQNPNNLIYLELAQESLQKYLSDHGIWQPHIVVRVDRVTTQVVAGSLTRINFVATPTDYTNSYTLNCFSKIWEQSWLNKKEINVSCDIGNNRVRRQIPGGETVQNPEDHQYFQLAEESLKKYVIDSGNLQPLKVVRVDQVTTQVVSGLSTKINFVASSTDNTNSNSYNCVSKIWEQSWLNKKEIDVSCDVGNNRVRRQIPGGETVQNPEDKQYFQLAEESLKKYVIDSGNLQPLKVVRVDQVTTQVVSGSLTKINFVASSTDNTNSNSYNCVSKIWEQSWLNKKEIDVSCDVGNNRVRRQIPGGETVQNPVDKQYFQLAEESLNKYVRDSGNLQPLKVVRVDQVTTQIVSGSLTKINFVASSTDNTNSNSYNCVSKIWEQSWLNKKEIDVSCDVGNNRVRRQIPGGETVQNPEDKQYFQLAEESLKKYVIDSGNLQPLKVVRVDQVTTQVVSGSLTKINFVASSTDNTNSNSYNCVSKIWEQSWLNKKEIDVSCDVGNNRVRRQIPGGETVQNPEDKQYFQLAEESLNKYLRENGNRQPHRVVKVDRVTTQIVAGLLTRINFIAIPTYNFNGNTLYCFSKILDQSWINNKEIDVTCNVSVRRVRRQIPGIEILRDPDDPKYIQLAEDSLYKYLTSNGIQRPHAVVRIDKITTQVVSGSLTTVYFVIAPTNNHDGEDKYCISKIWEQPWMSKNNIEISCSKKQLYTIEHEQDQVETIRGETEQDQVEKTTPESEQDEVEPTGDETEQDPKRPEYLKLAEESLQKYLYDCGNIQPHRIVRVDRVTTQVVVGSMTRINFVAMPLEDSHSHVINCFSKIFEQSWLNNKEIDVTCDVGNHRVRRGIPGGKTPQNAKDLKYLQLAEESLHKYLKDNGIQQPHRVLKVQQVTTQVVSGLLTRINFVATPTDSSNIIDCFSEIWEQEWMNKKEIQVRCGNVNHRVRRQLIAEALQDPSEPAYLDLGEHYLRRYVNDTHNQQLPKVGGDVSCIDNHRMSRQIDNVDEKENDAAAFFQLAEDSLKKYLCDSGIQESYRVIKVDNVTTQYDAGSITELDFVAVPSNNRNETTIICFSKIWEQIWLEIKEIDVRCDVVNNTVKKEEKVAEGCSSGTCTTEVPKVQKQPEVMEINETNIKKENETTKPEYLFLAARALHKFSKKIGVLHKLNSVIQVATSREYGMVYNIKFSASPTECFADVSITRALECRVSNTTVICDAIIREVPGLKRKIHVACDTDDEDADFDDYSDVEDAHTVSQAPPKFEKEDPQNVQKLKVQAIAQDALEQFLATTTKKHLYRIVDILSFYEHLTDGMISTIEFLISPTICFKGDIQSPDRCPLKIPNSVHHCNAKMRERPVLGVRRDIKVACKKLQTSKYKALYRTKRRISEDIAFVDNNIDEDYNDDFAENQERSTIDLYHRIQAENMFYEFLATYRPSYADDKNELELRFQIFKKNIKKIHELNIYEKGTATYGVTRFADLTYDEFRSRHTGLKSTLRDSSSSSMVEADIPSNITFPESFDWREFGAVTEVKDQGFCGSCWAFSATGNIEGQLKLHSGKLVPLSEQELLDCDHKDLGCDGGIPENAYSSIQELGGLDAESDYPYKGKSGKCRYNNASKKVAVGGTWNIGSNETNMAKWLVKNGPISIGLNAHGMQFYKEGIAHPWKANCNPSEVDHAALIVGYGVKEYPHLKMKLPYWIVKNSWGKSWGEEGYYLVYRGDGTCGINSMPTSAKIVST